MTTTFGRSGRYTALLVAGILTACGGGETSEEAPPAAAADGPAAPIQCSATDATLPSGVMAASLTGEYTLVLLGADDARTEGSLTLAEQSAELQSVEGPGGAVAPNTTMPLYGWTDVDGAAVGATMPGDGMSMDAAMPGVAVLETTGDGMEIMLRLGSEANERGVVRFDGAYFVLRVQAVDGSGFQGTWTSGVAAEQAEGPFCAVRN